MTKPDFEHYLQQQLNEPQEHAPQRDLWPGIEHALVQSPRSKRAKLTPFLASVAAIAVAVVMSVQFLSHDSPTVESPLASVSAAFEQQKQWLLVQYQSQPALTDNWQTQLQELEEAEQAIKQAFQSDPDNRALLGMLAQVYQQQLDLINKVHQPKQGAVLKHI